jgi:outer membrane protein insertion porin family
MRVPLCFLVALTAAAVAHAQTPPPQAPAAPASAPQAPAASASAQQTVCGQPVPVPRSLPPAGTGPVVYQIVPCFQKQGGYSVVEANTYLYYIEAKSRLSNSSVNKWVPYDDSIEQILREDFKRLWGTNFLDDLAIRVEDYQFANGVIGKMIVYDMEERERVKIVDYEGLKKVDQSKIEEKLKEKGITIRLDSFIDPGKIRGVTTVVRELYAAEGYQFVEITPETKPVEGGTKLVHVTFHITEGPKVRIKDIDFVGNKAISDGSLGRKMKENKEKGFFGFITGGGTYKEDKFAEDAQLVTDYYRDEGYIMAQVGQPEMKTLEDSEDGKTRWIQLQVPITEGRKYTVGNFTFEGNKVVNSEALRPLFKLDKGETYSQKKIKKGLEKAQEIYGSVGYFEFTAYPDLQPRDQPPNGDEGAAGPPAPSSKPADPNPADAKTADAKTGDAKTADGKAADAKTADAKAAAKTPWNGEPIVDVTMRVAEGKQYFINRITFVGNTTTRDNVIRREMRLVEAGVFNTQALKDSVRRLNQLGYFKPLEGEAVDVQKTTNAENKVDIQLKFEEQNRNQLTFGAGVSQFDGFFGQLSFQTSNFLGRGETFTATAQQGNRAKNYQLAFTEPFLFDRPMTAGIDIYAREIRYEGQFTQSSIGGNLVFGFQVANYSRMFINYSLEQVDVKDLNPLYLDPRVLAGNPFLADSLLIGEGGKRIISKIGPSFVYNTVDHPIFPTSGSRYTLSMDWAGIGGDTNFLNPRAEAIRYFPIGAKRRTSLGFRGQAEYIAPYASTVALPIFERLFLGGEYSMRGFDLRTVGPRDPVTGLVVGGNKSLLFNVEYLISIAGPVRLVLFYDAGQVRARGESFGWKEPVRQTTLPGALIPNPGDIYQIPFNPFLSPFEPRIDEIGDMSAFKTSTGAEIRFFMPVLNVPFRLIFAANPSRGGVLDNNLQPEKKWKFRFAVGSTF